MLKALGMILSVLLKCYINKCKLIQSLSVIHPCEPSAQASPCE